MDGLDTVVAFNCIFRQPWQCESMAYVRVLMTGVQDMAAARVEMGVLTELAREKLPKLMVCR